MTAQTVTAQAVAAQTVAAQTVAAQTAAAESTVAPTTVAATRGDGRDRAGPDVDVINTIALSACTDTRHRIHVATGDGVASRTLAELDRDAVRVACHLHGLGVRARDRIGIMATNRIEWVLLDLAALKLGAVTAGIEPGRHDPAQMIAEFGLVALFMADPLADPEEARARAQAGPDRVHDIATVATWAADPDADPAVLPRNPGYDPADVCAIKQTSGSTGQPKGIEATTASVNMSMSAVQAMFDHRDGDNLLVFLPVRFLQQRYWIYSALVHGHDVTLADRTSVWDVARATAPTVVMGVPGFYEQLKARVEAGLAGADGEPAGAGGEPAGAGAGSPGDGWGRPVDRVGRSGELAVRRRAILGHLGGRIRYLWTGSAPAGRPMLHFFNDAGVPLYEGYGLNETCIVSKNHPGAVRVGSVGKPLPHKRIRFDRDGVIIVGTAYPVNTRYTWSAPGASERVFLPTGEVRTYDVGHLDADGYLYIDGRVDDIVTLSSALNVLVPLVEERVRELPGVHECAVFGDGRPYLTVVVSPTTGGTDPDALAREVSSLNGELRYEQRIYAVLVAPEPFSIENGLLNAQFKLVRAEIGRRFADDLDLVYREHDVYNDGTATDLPVLVMSASGRVAA